MKLENLPESRAANIQSALLAFAERYGIKKNLFVLGKRRSASLTEWISRLSACGVSLPHTDGFIVQFCCNGPAGEAYRSLYVKELYDRADDYHKIIAPWIAVSPRITLTIFCYPYKKSFKIRQTL